MVSEPIELFGPKSMAVEKKPVIGMQKEQQEMKHTRKLRRLKYSCEEVYERMDNGLCIFCDELDTPGHHDLKHKEIQIFMVDDDLASDYIKEFHQSQETVTSPEPFVETAKNLDSFIEPLVHDSVSQALDSVPDMLMVHKVEELPQKSASGSGKKIAHQLFDQMPNEYQKDLTMIESSDKEVLSFSHKDDRVWEPGGLPTKMDLWNWKELKPYGESHKVKSNPEFNTFESNKTFSLEDEHDDETNVETNSLLEKERIPSRALCDQVPATQSQDFNVIQQGKLTHDTETIMEMGPVQEPESLGLTDSIFKVDFVPSQFQVPIPSLEPSRRCRNVSLDVVDERMCNKLVCEEDDDSIITMSAKFGETYEDPRFELVCLKQSHDPVENHLENIESAQTSSSLRDTPTYQYRAPFNPYQNCNDQCDRESEEIEDDELQDKQPEDEVFGVVVETLVINEDEQPLECADEKDAMTSSILCDYNTVCNDRQKGAVCDTENKKLLNIEAGAKKGTNSCLGGKIAVALARKKGMVSKVGGSTFDLECGQIKFNNKKEFVGSTEYSELRPSREYLLMNFWIFMIPQPPHDKIITLALLVGLVGTKEKLSDRLSLANYVWRPGELLGVQDQWDWISEVHNMGSVLKIMQRFHGLHLQGIINIDMRFREVIVHDVLSVKVCLSVCNRKFEAELEVYLLAHHNSKNQKIAGGLLYGDVNFHLKHKWRSRLLQTLSRLEFCVDDVILFTSSVKLLFFTKNHKPLHPETGFCTHYNGLEQLSTEFQGSLGLNFFTYLIFKWNQALNCGCEAGHTSSGFFSVGDVYGSFTCSKLQTGDETQEKRLLFLNNNNKVDHTIKENWFHSEPMIRGVYHLQRPPELIELQGNPNFITKVLVQWKEHPPDQFFSGSQWQEFNFSSLRTRMFRRGKYCDRIISKFSVLINRSLNSLNLSFITGSIIVKPSRVMHRTIYVSLFGHCRN